LTVHVDPTTAVEVAVLVVLVASLAAALLQESGRQALAKVGIAAAWLLLKVAEKSTQNAENPAKAEKARGAMAELTAETQRTQRDEKL
jgi:hypothetical protein